MECYIHPAMDYLHVESVVAKQRLFIAERTAARSVYVINSNYVHAMRPFYISTPWIRAVRPA